MKIFNVETPQLVVLKAKIGNSTINPPDEKSATPSALSTITEHRRILQSNETCEFPFTWKIRTGETRLMAIPLTLHIDGYGDVSVSDVGAKEGRNFRIIVELWTLDKVLA